MAKNRAANKQRSNSDAAHESVVTDVSDVLFNIEDALSRAKKARATAVKYDEEVNAKLAFDEAIASLEKTRKRLMQDAALDLGHHRLQRSANATVYHR